MDILPAIDLRGGKVVRLSQGDYARETQYSDDPAAVARDFAAAGARWIHVVDLDAAKSGRPTNTAALRAILSAVPEMKVEFGGGMRDTETIRNTLNLGAARIVVGSAALKDWPWFQSLLADGSIARKLALGLDARDGKLAVHGWTQEVAAGPLELAGRVKGSGLGAIIYTDISRDGMLTGPNFAATAGVVSATDVPVIASGGVGSIDHVARCKEVGCAGVIVGRAYYEGKVDLTDAIALAMK